MLISGKHIERLHAEDVLARQFLLKQRLHRCHNLFCRNNFRLFRTAVALLSGNPGIKNLPEIEELA